MSGKSKMAAEQTVSTPIVWGPPLTSVVWSSHEETIMIPVSTVFPNGVTYEGVYYRPEMRISVELNTLIMRDQIRLDHERATTLARAARENAELARAMCSNDN